MDIWRKAWLEVLETASRWVGYSATCMGMTEQEFSENLVMFCMQEPDI